MADLDWNTASLWPTASIFVLDMDLSGLTGIEPATFVLIERCFDRLNYSLENHQVSFIYFSKL